MNTTPHQSRLRVWDLPTRLFHWALAFCVFALIITGLRGGAAMEWHLRFGYGVAILLIFRIAWGFVGGYWSRFAQFFYSPITIIRHLRGQTLPAHQIGHNPLGSLSVWGLLIILVAQVASGLISDDEIATQGPFSKFVSNATALLATSYHRNWGKWIIMALVLLHVAAILFYLVKKKQNLIKPMLTGDKLLEPSFASSPSPSADAVSQRLAALVLFTSIAIGCSYALNRFS